jgi:hypothetical protein
MTTINEECYDSEEEEDWIDKMKPHHFGIKKCGYMNWEQFNEIFNYFLCRCNCYEDNNIKLRQFIDYPTYQAKVVVIMTHKEDGEYAEVILDDVHIGTDAYDFEFDLIFDVYKLEQLEMERINKIKTNMNEFILKKINKYTAQEILYKKTIDKVLRFI